MERTIYVDVNVFVYWLGGHPEFGTVAYRWVKEIEKDSHGRFLTSCLTLYELPVILAGLTGRSLKDKEFVEALVNPVISLLGLSITLTTADVVTAVELVEELRL